MYMYTTVYLYSMELTRYLSCSAQMDSFALLSALWARAVSHHPQADEEAIHAAGGGVQEARFHHCLRWFQQDRGVYQEGKVSGGKREWRGEGEGE